MRQTDIIKIANEKSVPKTTIDKDWVLGHLLNTFYSFIDNRANFIFKGGTCLRKCFFVDYRFSEKIRSLAQRNRPRDCYDVWFLSKQTDKLYLPAIKKLLIEKTVAKHIPVDSPFHFVNEKKREINLRHWEKSLQHQLPGKYLPDFNQLYLELTTFIEKIIKS
ncbi:hypothetical protein ES708_31187 [subsurface metagenome]